MAFIYIYIYIHIYIYIYKFEDATWTTTQIAPLNNEQVFVT